MTFSEMMMRPYPSHDIWAGQPIAKLGYAGIGFVAKRQNWFPEKSVLNTIEAVRSIIDPYPKRLGYGFSMGAWAILYYARLLNLDATVAFSPQYSIDPTEIEDHRFSQYFDPALNSGMAIRPDSGAAMNVVACDPADKGDWESATKICDRIDATLVKLVNAGHGSVKCVSRTAVFGNIVSAALSNDPEALATIVRQTRRNAPARAITISHSIAIKKPCTAFAIYTKYKALFPVAHRAPFLFKLRKSPLRRQCFREMAAIYGTQRQSHGYLAVLALYLNDMGRKQEALSCINRAIDLHDQPSYHFLKKQISG